MPIIASYMSTKFNNIRNFLGIKYTTKNHNLSNVKNTSTTWYTDSLSKKII